MWQGKPSRPRDSLTLNIILPLYQPGPHVLRRDVIVVLLLVHELVREKCCTKDLDAGPAGASRLVRVRSDSVRLPPPQPPPSRTPPQSSPLSDTRDEGSLSARMSQDNPPSVPPSASSTPAIPSATSSTIPPAAAQVPPLPPLRLNIFDRVRNNAARFAALAASATGTTGASTPGQASPVSLGPGSSTSLQAAGPPLVPTGDTTSTPARAALSAAPAVSSTAAPGSGKLTSTVQADDFDEAAIAHAPSSRPAVQPPPSAPPPAPPHQVSTPPPPPVASKETNGSHSAQKLTFKKIVPAANASTGGGSVATPGPAGGASPRVSTGGNLNGSGGHSVGSDVSRRPS